MNAYIKRVEKSRYQEINSEKWKNCDSQRSTHPINSRLWIINRNFTISLRISFLQRESHAVRSVNGGRTSGIERAARFLVADGNRPWQSNFCVVDFARTRNDRATERVCFMTFASCFPFYANNNKPVVSGRRGFSGITLLGSCLRRGIFVRLSDAERCSRQRHAPWTQSVKNLFFLFPSR